MTENSWNHDTHIKFTDEGEVFEEVVLHGVDGEADERITLEEIKACTKWFGDSIQDIFNDKEYSMALCLSLKAEAIQRGGKLEVNMLDTIPIMHKWLTRETMEYLKIKTEKLFRCEVAE